MSSSASSSRSVPVISLAELPALAGELVRRIREGKFEPELIVYLETGARLFAHEVATILRVPLAPIWVRRGGHGLKQKLAPLAARLPVGVRDLLRKAEERSGVHRVSKRTAELPPDLAVAGKRVLVLDDASDTGRSIILARELVIARGAAAANVRTAVLAATTPPAQAAVNFYVLDRNCRMPWSADSDERNEAAARAAKLAPKHAPRAL
jgi:hypoxanthine phosphoribosyltransferase